MWANAVAEGAGRLVLASVIESSGDLGTLLGAVPDADPFLVRLAVSDDVVSTRIRCREIGSARDWHLDRALELAAILEEVELEDAVVDAGDRPIRQIALEILAAARWPVPPE